MIFTCFKYIIKYTNNVCLFNSKWLIFCMIFKIFEISLYIKKNYLILIDYKTNKINNSLFHNFELNNILFLLFY